MIQLGIARNKDPNVAFIASRIIRVTSEVNVVSVFIFIYCSKKRADRCHVMETVKDDYKS